MALFQKAAAKSAAKPAKQKKTTTWVVGNTEESERVAKSIHELVTLHSQEKIIDAKKEIHLAVVMNAAKDLHVAEFCSRGAPPETPMLMQNNDGEKVTFVVQDRGGQYNVKEESLEAMRQILGDDAADELVYTETTIGFNREIMALPGVSDAIEKALEAAVAKLIKSHMLTEEQAEELITAAQKTSFKPGVLTRAAEICGRSTVKLSQFLDAMGSACTRYVKL